MSIVIDKELLKKVVDGSLTAPDLEDDELIDIIKYFEQEYRAGNDVISNNRFEMEFIFELRERYPEHEILNSVGEENLDDFEGEKVVHPYPMLSTDKVYGNEEILKWVAKVHASAQKLGIDQSDVYVELSPKLDGLAGRKRDGVLCTRGTHYVGVNITRVFERGVVDLSSEEHAVNGDILGEIIVKQNYYTQYLASEFKHPRNFVVGLVKSDVMNSMAEKACADEAVCFVPYMGLMRKRVLARDLVSRIDEIRKEMYEKSEYLLDGVVAEVVDSRIREDMGTATGFHRWVRAIKEEGESAESKCVGILRQTGRTGKVTPIALIEPVFISGCEISKPTAHNERKLIDDGIGEGAILKIIRAGEVIPKIVGVIKRADVVLEATHCPSCNYELVWDGAFKVCNNKFKCPAQSSNAIVHFMKSLGGVKNFGIKSVEKMVDAGFARIDKILRMSLEDYHSIGFGKTESLNFIKEIEKAKSKKIKDSVFISCFGFRYLGKSDSKKIMSYCSIDEFPNITEEDLIKIKGFGKKKSASIAKSLRDNFDLIRDVCSIGFVIEKTKGSADVEHTNSTSKISGLNIVITGEMVNRDRKEMEELAEKNGAKVQSQVNGKTNLVVAGDKAGDSKINKAKELGVKIINESDFLEMIS